MWCYCGADLSAHVFWAKCECITFTGLAYITYIMQDEKQQEQNAVQEISVPDVHRTTSKNCFTFNMFPACISVCLAVLFNFSVIMDLFNLSESCHIVHILRCTRECSNRGLRCSTGGLQRSHGQRQCYLEGCDWEERPPRSEPEWCFVTGLLC